MPDRNVSVEFASGRQKFNPSEWEPSRYLTSGYGHKKGDTCFRRKGRPREVLKDLPPGHRVHEGRVLREEEVPYFDVPAVNPGRDPADRHSDEPLRVLEAGTPQLNRLGPDPASADEHPAVVRRSRLALLGMARLHESRMPGEVKDFLRQAEKAADEPGRVFVPGYLRALRDRYEGAVDGFGRVRQAVSSVSPRHVLLETAQALSGPQDTPELQASSARHAAVIRSVFYQGKGLRIPGGPDVVRLARAAYQNSDRDALLALSDALEETGKAPQAVLDNLRNPHSAVRGNWVLDAILGRE